MDSIIVRYADNPNREYLWRLDEPVEVTLSDDEDLFIPVGFETDFASVPRIFWSIIPPIGKANIAWVIHDYLYDTKDERGRKWADDEMYYWMRKKGQSWLKSQLMYWGVRIGGRNWWKN